MLITDSKISFFLRERTNSIVLFLLIINNKPIFTDNSLIRKLIFKYNKFHNSQKSCIFGVIFFMNILDA